MEKKRDRSDEMQVYISKQHHNILKSIAEDQGRPMRKILERWIEQSAPTILK